MNCSKCGHPTNHKTGICAACTIDNEFGQMSSPASRPIAKKQNQGIKRGQAGTDLSQNPYLLDDLELLILAQVGYIFDLAKEGKLKQAVKRINLTNEALKRANQKHI